MLDLIDLTQSIYKPKLDTNNNPMILSFHDEQGDHHIYQNATLEQLTILRKNAQAIYNLLVEITS